MSSFFESLYNDADKNPDFVTAKLCLGIAKDIEKAMNSEGLNKAQLAEKLACSRPYVSKVLRGDANFTIHTLVKIAITLNSKLKMDLAHKSSVTRKIKKLSAGKADEYTRSFFAERQAFNVDQIREFYSDILSCQFNTEIDHCNDAEFDQDPFYNLA